MINSVAERARINIRKKEENIQEQIELEILRSMQKVIGNVSRQKAILNSDTYRVSFKVEGIALAENEESILQEVARNLGLEKDAIKEIAFGIYEVYIPRDSLGQIKKKIEEFEEKLKTKQKELKELIEIFISQNVIPKIEREEYEFERLTADKVKIVVRISKSDSQWYIFKYELKKERVTITTMVTQTLKDYGFLGVSLSDDGVTWYIELAA